MTPPPNTPTPDVRAIAGRLIAMERERLTGWKGPPGAAYNCISEDLSMSPLGLAVRTHFQEAGDE